MQSDGCRVYNRQTDQIGICSNAWTPTSPEYGHIARLIAAVLS
ncbi:hypothetical protein GCM10008018_19020 [Paenibacillus marchantiophytorum]|uniref:Uncharacterized protein n=1 Tax=Paenibacillus marchantiophytorum TaxID=1619310 RepID=A0ABQ2BVJ7_9BACL|nr:hypothetical protein GCM10008018_19020 [Paenibacillus marchantiophytorum]